MLTLITLITNKHICLHILLILFYGFLSFGAKRGLTVLKDTPWDCYDYLSTCDAKTLLGVRWRPVWMPQEYLLQVIKSKSASTFLRCLGIFHVANQIHIKGLVGFETEPPSEGGPFGVWWQAVNVKGSFVSGGRRRRRHVEPTWQGASLSLPVQNLSSSSRGESHSTLLVFSQVWEAQSSTLLSTPKISWWCWSTALCPHCPPFTKLPLPPGLRVVNGVAQFLIVPIFASVNSRLYNCHHRTKTYFTTRHPPSAKNETGVRYV